MSYLLENEETDRLLFRKIAATDYTTWLPFHQNSKSSKYWKGLPKNPKVACTQQFETIFKRYEDGTGGMNALINKKTGTLVGLCGLLVQVVDEQKELEIGYSILPEYWGLGYATEAAKKCKQVVFEKQWAAELICIIQIHNLPSRKVALQLEMTLRNTTTYKNNPVHIFSITA